MKKVAFFTDILVKEFDGATRTMFQIIERIDSSSFDFKFFTGMAPKSSFKHSVTVVPSVSIPLNKTYKIALPQLQQKRLEQELNNFKPDIIHIASPSFLGHVALQYARSNNIPVISIYHTHFISYVEYYCRYTPFLNNILKLRVAKSLKKFYEACDCVLVPTSQMTYDFEKMGINTSNHLVWPRGLDHSIFNPDRKNSKFIKDLVRNDRPNILFASRLVWEKNLNTLIKVYELAERQKLKANFLIAGDGIAKNTLKKKMPNAYFLGKLNQKELAKVYASSEVFLFPSYSETYGNVVIEAMASGLPPVIANGGGSKSFISHGGNGFLCNPNNPEEYLKYISQIIFDSNLSKDISANATGFTISLSWNKLVRDYFEKINILTGQATKQSEHIVV